ncbi:hypothetical protein GCM10028791_27250 [Echinicola sediminis]
MVSSSAVVFGQVAAQQSFKEYIDQIIVDPLGGQEGNMEVEQVAEEVFHITVSVDLPRETVASSWDINVFPSFEGSFHWAPHLTPTDDHIISDHIFRAPALIYASSEKVLALVPDLEARNASENRWYLDMDVPENRLSIGMSDYYVEEHVLFKKTSQTNYKAGTVAIAFYLLISDQEEDIANPWRKPLAFMWDNHGKALFESGEPVKSDLQAYVNHTYNWAFNTWKDPVWQEFDLEGTRVGAPVFIVNYTQSPNYSGEVNEREFKSIWNQAWFNSLRSAQGLFRYGRRTGNQDYIEKAQLTKELALSFPQDDGLFPSVIAAQMEQKEIGGAVYNRSKGWDTYYFGNSNRNPFTNEASDSPYHIVDMSCTAYFMLMWYQELEKDERLLAYSKKYADRLLRLMGPEGFFPAWVSLDGKMPMGYLDQSPESAKSISFLLKLYEITQEERYKDAGLKAMEAVIDHIIPVGKWEDFETYWSCSRWGSGDFVGKKIPRNNMYKQNTLAIFWTAEALLSCYEASGNERFLTLGQRVLDELLMAQAVWQPDYMHINVFGGFGVMNADAEWNDSRQALFSELLIRYGKTLGQQEYIHRGISALKASFSMMYCPENPTTKLQWEAKYPFFNEKDYGFMMENYGHGGYAGGDGEGIGVFTIYDWGNGAASEAYNRIFDHYGDQLFRDPGL